MYLQKLTELLFTEKEIEEDIMQTLYYPSKDPDNIIGNMKIEVIQDIQLRHMLWYCGIKKIQISIIEGGNIFHDGPISIEYNVTKELNQQSEEVLGEIYNFLK